ncbi:hypothetical protein [Sphingobium sp. HWE2-09]|uniref:hypothetical protein n=1 Tax=Sphingobium sp. HWE2-09 TaxID=3108390 RepID=UPI002DC31966|nr:hypothetical protein [Sphingobium sp. HWE2-09]
MKPSVHGTTVPITKAIRQKLRAEIKRTGVTAMMLLKEAPDLPDGLTVAHVNRWIGGVIDAARARHIDYVMSRWASLPDNAGRVSSNGSPLPKRGKRFADSAKRIEVTAEMSRLLRSELARTGIDHATLLDGMSHVPEGLNARIIAGWLYRQAATTNEIYWAFVMTWLGAAPDLSAPLSVPLRKPRKIHL